MRIKLAFAFLIFVHSLLTSQVLETKNWCLSRCDLAGDERQNAELLYLQLANDSIKNYNASKKMIKFPLRIGIIQKDTVDVSIKEIRVRQSIFKLNESFKDVGFLFYIAQVDVIISPYFIEDLSQDLYEPYNNFSDKHKKENMISLYIFDHKNDFCQVSQNSISCGRTGGFSYVLSNRTNNIVMSKFDLSDQKVLAHEFGHFFGLYHTFEDQQFGKDNFIHSECANHGDRICDTPPDPGAIFEIYVNYSDCEMQGLKNVLGADYKPLIQNYMSYYKPCYLKEYSFTAGQIEVMRSAGHSKLRKRFSR